MVYFPAIFRICISMFIIIHCASTYISSPSGCIIARNRSTFVKNYSFNIFICIKERVYISHGGTSLKIKALHCKKKYEYKKY